MTDTFHALLASIGNGEREAIDTFIAFPRETQLAVLDDVWPRARLGDAMAIEVVSTLSWQLKVNRWRPAGGGWWQRVAEDAAVGSPKALRDAAIFVAAKAMGDDVTTAAPALVALLRVDPTKQKALIDGEGLLAALMRCPVPEALEPALSLLVEIHPDPLVPRIERLVMAIVREHPVEAQRLAAWRATPGRPRLSRVEALEAQLSRAAASDLTDSDLVAFVEAVFAPGVRRALASGVDPRAEIPAWCSVLHVAVARWCDGAPHASTLEVVRALVGAGADPHMPTSYELGDPDDGDSWRAGTTPVVMARRAKRQLGTKGLTVGDEYRCAAHADEILAALGVAPKPKAKRSKGDAATPS